MSLTAEESHFAFARNSSCNRTKQLSSARETYLQQEIPMWRIEIYFQFRTSLSAEACLCVTRRYDCRPLPVAEGVPINVMLGFGEAR